MDSFPSYPLSDDLFKIDINLTKEQEKQIEELKTELLLKEELKKKKKEKIQMIEKMKKISQLTINENTEEFWNTYQNNGWYGVQQLLKKMRPNILIRTKNNIINYIYRKLY